MKFGVDVRWMLNNYRGMGRFAESLIRPLLKDVVGLAPNNIEGGEYKLARKGNSFFPWWEQFILPLLAKEESLDFLILPYNTGPIFGNMRTKQVVVIHDLIFMRSKSELPLSTSLYQTLGRYYRRFVVPRIVVSADVIITVSEYTKSELVELLNVPEDKIVVIPNSIKNKWFITPMPLNVRKQYVFTVAGEAPSKNVSNLLKAFAIAKKNIDTNIVLRIAGIKVAHHSVFIKQARGLGIENCVEFLGFISEEELALQYREARVFIFASLFEGFGIPLLEAMASGTPVCCSNTTSLPEVVGDNALLFDPIDTEDIAKKLTAILSDKQNEVRVSKAYSRAYEFSESVVNEKIKVFWSEYCGFNG